MILVDTSIWVDHLRHSNARLVHLLEENQVLAHPFVIGEVALGHLRQRALVVATLSNLPPSAVAGDGEVLQFIERQKLHGLGIGYVDAHLLAATRLTPGALLWTGDKRLTAVAAKLDLAMTD